jgi:hypothetical protein
VDDWARQVRELIDRVGPHYYDVIPVGDDLVIIEFTTVLGLPSDGELAKLENHGDGSWTLHVRSSDDEREAFFVVPARQPLEVILPELRDDPSGYFWG